MKLGISKLDFSFLYTGILAALVFALLSRLVHFPLSQDDFLFSAKALKPGGILISDFSPYLASRPIWAWVSFFTFKWNLFAPNLLIPIYFLIYSLSFSYLCRWILEKIDLPVRNNRLVFFSLFILIFYPSHHEVFYDTINLPYQLGLTFLVLALFMKNFGLKSFFFGVSFLSFESYVLPAFFLPLLPYVIIRRRPLVRELVSELLPWFFGILIYQLFYRIYSAQFELSPSFRSITPLLSTLTLHQIWVQFTLLMKFLWEIQFYKTNYFSTAFELGAWALIVATLYANKLVTAWQIVLLFLITLLSGGHNLLLSYYAPRAVFGAAILRNVLFFSLIAIASVRIPGEAVKKRSVLVLLFIAYLVQTTLVMRLKNYNFQVLEKKEIEVRGLLEKDCGPACTIVVKGLGSGFKQDFIMPDGIRLTFLEWARLRYTPEKKVDFIAD